MYFSVITSPIKRYGLIKKSISLFLYIIICSWFSGIPPVLSTDVAYIDCLIQDAEQKQLYNDRYWHILLHYKKTVSGVESLIDDPRFFLSPEGKHNPQAELEATLRALFNAPSDTVNPPLCRFIARYTWLKEKLGFDESRMPVAECTKFNTTMEVIKPKAATLIFPAGFMNNPASMFGHTFINIETASRSKLLSHAVNYSAFTDETNGLVFALKGLSGFYKGYFSILPYYQKVQEYSDIGQRDIWEYCLNLSEDEVKKMIMHIWELQGIYSYYYFFDENCSYTILFLLEAARPSLHLTDQFNWWTIPVDTIKALQKAGVIETVDYRPSKATLIKYIASSLNREQQVAAIEFAKGVIEPEALNEKDLSEQDKIKILDLAIEYLQYSYVKKQLTKDRYTDLFLKLLKTRSSLGKTGEATYQPPRPPEPDKGHNSSRIGVGFGLKKGSWFEEIRYRIAYHALIDNDAGFDSGSQIQFLNTALRYYSAKNKIQLKQLDVVDIISLAPRDMLFKPFSWKVKTGFIQKMLHDGHDHLVYQLNTGGGFSYTNKFFGLFYGMIEGDINGAGSFKENYALGIGASTGLKKHLTGCWTMLLNARALYYGLGDEHKTFELSMKHNLAISTQRSITCEVSRIKSFGIYQTESAVLWNYYF